MSTPDDFQIDERLRSVPLPRNLADGMQGESLFDDAAIDRLLVRIEPPAGLVDRVRSAAVAGPPRSRPQGTVDLERIAAAPQPAFDASPRTGFGRGLAAAFKDVLTVATVLGIVTGIVVASSELSRQLGAGPAQGKSRTVAREETSAALPAVETPRARPSPPVAAAAGQTVSRSTASAPTNLAPTAPAEPGAAAAAPAADVAVLDESRAPAVRGAAVDVGLTGIASRPIPTWARACEVPGESLRRVPRLKEYDIGHEMTYGEQPFIDPAAAALLASDSPPLCLHTNSFDRRLFERGPARWTSGLRAEHVLAALPTPVLSRGDEPPARASAPAAAALRLDLRAVPSLRVAPRPSVLVEVAATAALGRPAEREVVAATIVLDRSVGSDPLVWRWMCRGLAAVAADMGPDDRVSLFVGGSLPQLALNTGDAASVAALADQLERQPPVANTDLDAVVRTATQAAKPAGESRLIIVAQAATLEHARDDVRTPLAAWHAALAECGGERFDCLPTTSVPRFIVVDAAAPAEPPARQPSFGRTAADPVAIRRSMVQHVFGRDTLAARQCRLEIAFDPRQVAAYRLVGHRQSAFESLSTDTPAAVDLHRGETARVVYEVVPRTGFGKSAVSATVNWRDAGDGKPRRVSAALAAAPGGSAALPDPNACELLLAVALGDAAGGSPHGDAKTAAAARALAARWQARRDVSEFGSRLIECIERTTPDRKGPR